ncbi:MAG: hypothetical protein GX971_01265, partial [Firmicutes bacterium]|nr:hypothetical protein [Bacillota bacterium]
GKSGATLRYHSTVALAKSLFEAGASVKVTPMDKLTVTPAVDFKSFKDGNVDQAEVIRQLRDADYYKQYIDAYHFTAGSILTLKADASYKVGGNATLTLSAGNHAYNFTAISGDSNDTLKYNNPFASLAVKVKF